MKICSQDKKRSNDYFRLGRVYQHKLSKKLYLLASLSNPTFVNLETGLTAGELKTSFQAKSYFEDVTDKVCLSVDSELLNP